MYKISKVVVGAAVLAVSAVAIPVSSAMASGATNSHTLRVISHNTANKLWRQEPSFAFTGVDRDAATGAKVGLDMLDCAANLSTHKAYCDVTLALRGGLLRGTLRLPLSNSPAPATGTITGGTRDFTHVTGGTITALPTGHDELVTVTYHS